MISRIRAVEWGVLTGVGVLLAIEVAAALIGLGYFFAIVGLGYLVVLGLAYWLYRQAGAGFDEPQTEEAKEHAASEPHSAVFLLKHVDIFSHLSYKERRRVASLGKRLRLPAGKGLGTEGEPGYLLFAIIEGQAQLVARSPVGNITVRIAGPGESLPLASIVDEGLLVTSVVAMTDMEVLAIPCSSLMELCSEEPQIGLKLYAVIAGILAGRYRNTLRHLTAGSAKALKKADFWANV